jgi:xylan 1,4-beta-xylosidase
MIRNPILPGFHPDPSLVRVGEDFYLATSTFEWFPGIRLHRSRDLTHWEPVGFALTRTSQLDLKGCEASTGVWAPCLTWVAEEGRFYLAFTVMRGWSSGYFDLDNFLVTSVSIGGTWSEPVYLNSSGFDPSFFHEDGRHWLVNLEWETRPGHQHPGSIVLQEFSWEAKALVGEPQRITQGLTKLGCLEGPHVFRRGDWYYLMTAEGGTGFGHAVVLARSKFLEGPWQTAPEGPLLSSALDPHLDRLGVDDFLKPYQDNPELPIQKAGHGSLVETSGGEWYLAHLGARPRGPHRRSPLGRETFLQKVEWTADGWLRLAGGGYRPRLDVVAPALPAHPVPVPPVRDDFDSPVLGPSYQSLRVPFDETWASLTARPGFLRLRGRESLSSSREQSLVARRVQAFRFRAETRVEFSPASYKHAAGLVVFYDQQMYSALGISFDEALGQRLVGVVDLDNGKRTEPGPTLVLEAPGPVSLRAEVDAGVLRFWASSETGPWTRVGPDLDASRCSDEYSAAGHFTGAFVGLFCADLRDRRVFADFDHFTYEEGTE